MRCDYSSPFKFGTGRMSFFGDATQKNRAAPTHAAMTLAETLRKACAANGLGVSGSAKDLLARLFRGARNAKNKKDKKTTSTSVKKAKAAKPAWRGEKLPSIWAKPWVKASTLGTNFSNIRVTRTRTAPPPKPTTI